MRPARKLKVQRVKLLASDDTFKYRFGFLSSSGRLYFDGDLVDLSNKRDLTFDGVPTVIERYIRKEVDYYEREGQRIEKDEYDSTVKQLKKDGGYDDYDDYATWSDLEKEYEFKKYVQNVKPVYKDVIEDVECEIEMDDTFILETGDKYIVSDYFLGKTSPICTFNSHSFMVDTFRQLALEAGLTDSEKSGKTYHIPNHSGLRYAKINGNYIFSKSKFDTSDKTKFRGTYERCIELKDSLERDIKDIVDLQLRAMDDKLNISPVEIIAELRSISATVSQIDYKVKSGDEHRQAMRKINNLLERM